MSKSALKALANAQAMIKAAGVVVSLVEYLNDGKSRTVNGKKLWRNADILTSLIINSAANCFQTETPESLDQNGYESMAQAVDGYISSNLDDWSQVEWVACKRGDVKPELDRLAEMVNRHIEYLKNEAINNGAMEIAGVCNACACLIANDDADSFSNSFTEKNARIGVASWRKEWGTLSIDHGKTDRDVSFRCDCCGERIHGEKFCLVLANFRN